MQITLLIKTLFRTPVRSSVIFLLLTAVSLALFVRAAEYAITRREMTNAAESFRGVGAVEITAAPEINTRREQALYADPRVYDNAPEWVKYYPLDFFRYEPISADQVTALASLPYISSADTRYMTAGVSDTYIRLFESFDTNWFDYTGRFIVEGTVRDVNTDAKNIDGYPYNTISLENCVLLAGHPALLSDFGTLEILAYAENTSKNNTIVAHANIYDSNYIYDTPYVNNLSPGERYVFIGCTSRLLYDPDNPALFRAFLYDYMTAEQCAAIVPLSGLSADYLETDRFTPLRQLIEITNADLHTLDVVYTDDMTSILRFAEGNMAAIDGRLLTPEDSRTDTGACVISDTFAAAYELQPGDTLTLKLGDKLFTQFKGLGALAVVPERYVRAISPVSLEIVGIYADMDGRNAQIKKPNWSYSVNTVFVPKHLLPLDERTLTHHAYAPGEFSFTVDSAWDIQPFLDETAPLIGEMGFTLFFDDGGWPDVAADFEASLKLSVIAAAALIAAVAAAVGLIVFLYLARAKKDYAIMRALGTPKETASRAAALPLILLAVTALLAGNIAGWFYLPFSLSDGNHVPASAGGYLFDSSVPLYVVFACLVGELAFFILLMFYGLRKLGMRTVLALFQNQGDVKRMKHERPVGLTPPESTQPQVSAQPENGSPHDTRIYTVSATSRAGSGRHVLRYIVRHLRRSKGKSMLLVLMTALLIGAVGQFSVTQRSYLALCKSIPITARFVNGLPLGAAYDIAKTDYVDNTFYYEAITTAYVGFSRTTWVSTNDVSRYTGVRLDITYANGYGAESVTEPGPVCLIGQTLLDSLGLHPGDSIQLYSAASFENLRFQYIYAYRSAHPDTEKTDDDIAALYSRDIIAELKDMATTLWIAASFRSTSGKYDSTAFTPGEPDSSGLFGGSEPLDLAEYTAADNLRLDEFRDYAAVLTDSTANSSDRLTFYMDTDKVDNILNTIGLLDTLYPAVVAAAVFIGAVFAVLVILQSARETAMMRALGTPRRRVVAMMSLEQLLLSVIGVALGLFGLLIYNGSLILDMAGKLTPAVVTYVLGNLTASIAGGVAVTRRSVLGLLQVKE